MREQIKEGRKKTLLRIGKRRTKMKTSVDRFNALSLSLSLSYYYYYYSVKLASASCSQTVGWQSNKKECDTLLVSIIIDIGIGIALITSEVRSPVWA